MLLEVSSNLHVCLRIQSNGAMRTGCVRERYMKREGKKGVGGGGFTEGGGN